MNDLESKVQALELEIRVKNQVMRRLNRQASVGRVLPAYLHAINAPLALLPVRLSSLFRECQAKGITNNIQSITRDFEHLMELLHNLSHLSGFEILLEREVSLNECIRDTTAQLEPLFQYSDVWLQTSLSEEGEYLLVLGEATSHVVASLILNALDALSESRQARRLVVLETAIDDTSIRVRVSDNGPGVAPEHMARIWEPGFTTRRHRVGIGLTIAKDIVESLGGTIFATSAPAEFTRFTVLIPRNQEAE